MMCRHYSYSMVVAARITGYLVVIAMLANGIAGEKRDAGSSDPDPISDELGEFDGLLGQIKDDTTEKLQEFNERNMNETKTIVDRYRSQLHNVINERFEKEESRTQEIVSRLGTVEAFLQNNTNATHALHTVCPDGMSEFGDKCVFVIYKFKAQEQWEGANDVCKTMGKNGRLVEVRNVMENFLVRWVLYNVLWDHTSRCFWIGVADNIGDRRFRLSGGQPAYYTRWGSRQPNRPKNSDKCVCMGYRGYGNYWVDEPCKQRLGFVCQIDKPHEDAEYPIGEWN